MEQEFDLKTYLDILRRRYIVLILPAVAVFALSCAVAYLLPKVYHASAKIIVESQQIPNDLARSTVTSAATERIAVIRQRLMTRSNLLKIAREFNLFAEEREQLSSTAIVDLMRQAAQIERIDAGNSGRRGGHAVAFTVSFDYSEPQLAASVANQFVRLILEQNIRSRTSRASKTHKFFEQQVAGLEKMLVRQEAAIVEFKSKYEAALPDSMAYRRALLTALQSRIPEIEQKIQALEAQKELITESGELVATDELGQQLAKLRIQLKQLEADYSDRHPAVKRLRKRVAALEKASQTDIVAEPSVVDGEHEDIVQDATPKVSREIAAIDRQLAALHEQQNKENKRITELEETLTKTPQVEIALNALTREYQSFVQRLSQARAKMAQAATGEQLEEEKQAERFEVIEQATAPGAPTKPDRPRIILAGFFVSAAAGVGMVLLFELLDQTIRNAGDLQKRLQIRPLSTIPMVLTAADRSRRKKNLWLASLAMVIVAVLVVALVHAFYQPLDLIWIKLMQKAGV